MDFRSLLQDARRADLIRELRCAQRLADSDSGPRPASWSRRGIRAASRCFDWSRPRAHVKGDRLFRPWPARCSESRFVDGGSWSAYWYGKRRIYSSEINGVASTSLSSSAVARSFRRTNSVRKPRPVHFAYENVQDQQKLVWPPSYPLSRAYLDQLERTRMGSRPTRSPAPARRWPSAAEKSGIAAGARKDALQHALAAKLHADAGSATDAAKAPARVFGR